MARGLEFMEGGRRWQVRGISFQIIVEQKTPYSPHWKRELT
jgi:hypothetical protein